MPTLIQCFKTIVCKTDIPETTMAYVFYDVETTGTNTFFDQILQFAAIRTDDTLKELDRFNVRCRLLPHVIPSPRALLVTKVTPATLTDTNLPSHYEMLREIHDTLHAWSPATFIGFNSLKFDENLLRQALFQTLHPPYLTNTNGNARSDVIRLAHAASLYSPEAITVPTNRSGRQVFQLGPLAAANEYSHHAAHEALADVLATLHLARLIRNRAPDVWQAMDRATTKAFVKEYVRDTNVFTLSESYFSRMHSWLVTLCGQHPERDAELAVFDLSFNPNDYLSLAVSELVEILNTSPKPIRSLTANQQPIIMSENAAPAGTRALDIPPAERLRRTKAIQDNPEFQKRVGQALARRFTSEKSSPYVEQRIYDGFPSGGDRVRMKKFHQVAWDERMDIAAQVEDPRISTLARRLICIERPDLLPTKTAAEFRGWVSKRVIAEDDSVPWMTVSKALRDTDALLQNATGSEAQLLREVREFVHSLADHYSPT